MVKKIKLFIVVLCMGILFGGCGYPEHKNYKANDELSKAVYEAVGEDIYYQYKKKEENGILEYEFCVENENEESLYKFIDIVDDNLAHREDKVMVILGCYIPGGTQYVMRISNYSDKSLEKADLQGAGSVYAIYTDIESSELFNNPEIYTHFKDVRYFAIDKKLQNIAEEKGIDWYQVWDNLESFEIV